MAILSGSATADNAVIITIPAGKWWRGSVSISSSLVAGASVGAQQATATVKVHGTNADPVDGSTLAGVSMATPAVGALSLLGITSNQSLDQAGVVIHAPAENSVTLNLHTPASALTIATAHGIATDF